MTNKTFNQNSNLNINNGSLTAGYNNDLNNLNETHIIGSQITATTLNTIFVNNLNIGDDIFVPTPTVPATSGDTGTTGQIFWDNDYIYICVATNTWKRVAITTW